METKKSPQKNLYQIRVRETLDLSLTAWFGSLTLTPLEGGDSLLTGTFPDQSALRGFLDQLWNLNFTVVSVEKVSDGSHSDPMDIRKEK